MTGVLESLLAGGSVGEEDGSHRAGGVVTLESMLEPREASEWPAIFPETLSPSSIASAGCPEKWRRKYLMGERDRSNGNFIVGGGVHGAIEHNYRQKIETHADLPLAEVLEVAAVSFDDKARKDDEKYGVDWEGEKPGELKDLAVKLADVYHRNVAPLFQPTGVEEWVEVRIPGIAPTIRGRVDVRDSNTVLDVKTSKNKPANGQPSGDWRLKGLIYQRITGLGIGWHVLTKGKTPAFYTPAGEAGLWMPPTPASLELGERRIRATVDGLVSLFERYGPEEPWPTTAPEHTWACGLCSFKPTCRWWAA